MYAYFHCKKAQGCDKLLIVEVREVTGLNKKIYAVCMLAMLLTAGCTQNKQETVPEDEDVVNLPEEEQQDEETGEEQKGYDVELSDKLSDFQFSINDTVYTLPAKLEEWKKAGWAYEKDDGKKALDPESFLEGETLDSESGALFVDVVNLDGEKKLLGECYVGGVQLESQEEDSRVYQLPGGIKMGTSTLDDVTEAYGVPTDQYEEKDNIYLTYEYGIYKQADLVFDVQDEILYKAVLKNYREPEDSSEEVSRETPVEVESYQAPGAFPEDIMQFVVRYGGDFYKLPAPVSEFTKNGWKISEDGSDSIVKRGRHGYVTLERDGQMLYAVVNNYADMAVPLENSFVISVHGDFDVTKVSVEIYRGITLGMSEETMKALLGDNAYETEETDSGVSYFIYADEEKRNYTRIFVDKDLKLVREIELSNSPDTLSAAAIGMPKEEPDSVDAAAMYGDDDFPGEANEE